jgi:hypothetical protein
MRQFSRICLAVVFAAFGLVGIATGATWTPQGVATVFYGSFAAVSCSSGAACMAVGYYTGSGSGTHLPLAEEWNGARWSIERIPLPAGGGEGELDGVACTSRRECVAVGTSGKGTLAERWNGRGWSIQRTPNPSGVAENGKPIDTLQAISCASSGACMAVGQYYDRAQEPYIRPLAELWDGTHWSIQGIRTPQDGGTLYGVSCVSRLDCQAVGANEFGVTLTEGWYGRNWSIETTHDPYATSLNGVSCTSRASCLAVGVGENSDPIYGGTVRLAERWDGKVWSTQRTARPPLGNRGPYAEVPNSFGGVSCFSSRACAVVGQFKNTEYQSVPLAERWGGAKWIFQATPSPAVGGSNNLNAVSCPTPSACIAVGSYSPLTGSIQPFVERWA